ncbi:LysM domain-containing protein [Actinopolyspora lacussalsi subsp. righensis]|uniref:LysM domain-containing protein n=1 Tax=Actinopolyspora righensis TaxID=995060 RepID=A0A1I6Y3N3_9ACTN|nr:transglycosylase family protein [Actinopolyspora righensis]SFT45150.1 LysM domain-containing protein [Actinopolyspora righensis]
MARYKGKHRKSSNFTRNAARVAVAGAVVATPLAVAAPASAADWDELAQCESSGDWHINTGNGFYGGLQFTPSTWSAFGGDQYAPNAHQASRAEQIAIAKKVLAQQGPGAWPGCTAKTNWVSGSTESAGTVSEDSAAQEQAAAPQESAPKQEQPAETESDSGQQSQQSQQSTVRSNGADYTVRSGDTLSEIGQRFGVNYQDIYERNSDILESADLIFPGQQLDIR